MAITDKQAAKLNAPVLAIDSFRAILFNSLLIITAALLPALTHLLGLPVRLLLPMHWPVLLAGLVYGWRGGLLVGLASPLVSYLISGMPLPAILPAMTIELAVYGFVAGIVRNKIAIPGWLALAIAIAAGRMVFIGSVIVMSSYNGALSTYLMAALIPGIPAAIAQILLLPPLAKKWVGRS